MYSSRDTPEVFGNSATGVAVLEGAPGVLSAVSAVGVVAVDGSPAAVVASTSSRASSLPPQATKARVRRTTDRASMAGIQCLAILITGSPLHVYWTVSQCLGYLKVKTSQQTSTKCPGWSGHLLYLGESNVCGSRAPSALLSQLAPRQQGNRSTGAWPPIPFASRYCGMSKPYPRGITHVTVAPPIAPLYSQRQDALPNAVRTLSMFSKPWPCCA